MARYLLVDDNVAFAENLAEIIQDLGHEAVVAESGERALELARQSRFDVLVSDMRMPGMSGTEVVRRLRELDAAMPALIVTAFTDDEELERARRAGVFVLPKPVPMAELLALLGGARRDGVVAVVEDDRALADNLSEILREHGFAPVVAGSIADLEWLGEVPLFAAIVDLRLPGGADGEMLRRLTARFPSLPLLVATGHAELAEQLTGFACFLKPFGTAALVARLEMLHAARPR
jgi:DNA-binding response OmpR family regulator